MKGFRLIAVSAILIGIFSSCQEEIWPSTHVQEGIPTAIDFSISVPVADDITVTKGPVSAYESEIQELILVMFEEHGRKMVLDLTPYMDAGTVNEGQRTYTLTRPIDKDKYGENVLSGTYRVYAIANWSSPFCQLNDLDTMNEDDLLEQIATNSLFLIDVTGDQRFPMSSYTEGVVISADPEVPSNININLKRLISRIEFSFKNGQSVIDKPGHPNNGKNENPNFTPKSYAIYNLPSKANLFSSNNNVVVTQADDFAKTEDMELTSSSFQFFMLENLQNVKDVNGDSCDSQAKREQWIKNSDATGVTAPEDKTFKFAPDYGTFVVVKGEYTGTSYIGNVTYTIHLGNFSEKKNTENGKDYSNFKVNRNEWQRYNVTINGVNSIFTEVTTDTETQPGVEGSFTETAKNVFVLDAHYEKVMLDLTGIEAFNLFVDTPKSPANNGNDAVNIAQIDREQLEKTDLDYKWIHFIKPTSASQFPLYDSDPDSGVLIGDIYDLAQDIIKGEQKYYNTIDGKVLTAAFIDEYFYDDLPLEAFVGNTVGNRTLSLRPGIQYSPDGNSSLVQNSQIEISQRSIKTTYALDGSDPNGGTYIPFGIETWDETGKIYFYGTSQNSNNGNNYSPTGLTTDNGWQNTKILTSGAIGTVNPNQAGYLTSVSDNSKESHVYSTYININESNRVKGYNACLLRNRDENGNNVIDDNELKWYLPAIEQYTNIWLSEDQLMEDTQLFDRANLGSVTNELDKASIYYSSSPTSARLYWAFQGAAYGQDYGSTISNPRNGVRCVRNLVSDSSKRTPSDLVSIDQDKMIISASNITAIRKTTHFGEYGMAHTERSNDNLLPSAFEIAKIDLQTKEGLTIEFGDENGMTREGLLIWYEYTCTLDLILKEGYTYEYNGERITGPKTFSNTGTPFSITIDVTTPQGQTKQVTITFEWDKEVKHSEMARNTFTRADIQNNRDLCSANYSQETDEADLGQWRVPNQREFMLMVLNNIITPTTSHPYVSSTFLTNWESLGKTEPFGSYGQGITTQVLDASYVNSDYYYIRCVRDAQYHGGDNDDNNDDDTPPTIPPVDEGGDA